VTIPSYPVSDGGADEQPAKPKAPNPVKIAFWIWVVSAVVNIVGGLLVIGQKDTFVRSLQQHPPKGVNPSQYDSIASASIAVTSTGAIIFAALYVLLAWAMLTGRNWARITLTALTVIGVLFTLFSGTSLYTLIGLVVALLALALLYLPVSGEYFAAAKRFRTGVGS
jgi:hypothetical protein